MPAGARVGTRDAVWMAVPSPEVPVMKRVLPALLLSVAVACADPAGPSPSLLYSSYFLFSVDGKFPPVPLGSDGTMLLSSWLGFGDGGRPRGGTTMDGMVRYVQEVQRPGYPPERSDIYLNYQIRGDELRIDLCPPLALCIIESELVGTIEGRTAPLALTHYLGGQAGSVYQFYPALPD